MKYENEYRPHSEIPEDFEPRDNPEFAAFMDHLAQDLRDFKNKEKVRILNPEGYKNFQKAFLSLAKIIRKDNPDADISYKLNDAYDGGVASIKAISYGLDIDDVATFVNSIKHSFGIGISASNEQGKIVLCISFNNVYNDLFIGDSLESESE